MKNPKPLTSDAVNAFARNMFVPISRDECSTSIWVPMAGRRKITNFLINNVSVFERVLPNYEDYLLCYVDPLDLTEESKSGYIRLIGKSLVECLGTKPKFKNGINTADYVRDFDNESMGYSRLLDVFKDLLTEISDSGLRVVLFLGEFDELTYVSTVCFGNLKSLWNKLFPNLQFVFLLRSKATKTENIRMWGEELTELVMQNIHYFPLLEEADIHHVMSNLSKDFKYKFSDGEIQTVKKLCGGHPYMLKVAARAIVAHKDEKSREDLKKMLLEHQELISIGSRIYRRQMEPEKQILNELVRDRKIKSREKDSPVDYLFKTGLLRRNDKGEYVLFGEIFKEGWKRPSTAYIFKCPKHGYVRTHTKGYDERLECPECNTE